VSSGLPGFVGCNCVALGLAQRGDALRLATAHNPLQPQGGKRSGCIELACRALLEQPTALRGRPGHGEKLGLKMAGLRIF
jgi:hypothetical protein